jgi:hypothetical protein
LAALDLGFRTSLMLELRSLVSVSLPFTVVSLGGIVGNAARSASFAAKVVEGSAIIPHFVDWRGADA